MRTNIVIDDKLMKDALRATGLKTKREAVELGLRTLLRLRQQEQIRRYRGKLRWEGPCRSFRCEGTGPDTRHSKSARRLGPTLPVLTKRVGTPKVPQCRDFP